MLDIARIRQLVEMMVANDLVEISLRDGEEEINLRRPNIHAFPEVGEAVVRPAAAAQGQAQESPAKPVEGEDESDLVPVESPMVGTFYASPDQDSPPFVKVGSSVTPGTIVCILEAMKVFNEIKAEVTGTIERILTRNAQAVEYGQALFLIRPS